MPAGIPTIKPIMIPAINDLASIVLNRSIVFSGTNLPIKRSYADVVMVANHVTGKRPLRSLMGLLRPGIGREKEGGGPWSGPFTRLVCLYGEGYCCWCSGNVAGEPVGSVG